MFPICWAVVKGENKSSWSWFIELLKGHLGLNDGSGWSVIFDQQKGLVDTLLEDLPLAEHRKCARHVSANWKIKHKSVTARKELWDTVYSCNEHECKLHLAELKHLLTSGEDPGCYDDFINQDYKTFTRAYVSRLPKCDSIESNICETFNGCIVKCKGFRMINMFDWIRGYVMGRLVSRNKLMFEKLKWDRLCPRIVAKMEKLKLVAKHCVIRQTSELVCECEFGDFRYIVDLDKSSCTCGYWGLSGVPCIHAIAVASFLRKDISYWVHQYYSVRYACASYDFGGIPPLLGQQAWEDARGNVILPPKDRVMPGRPKKNRRREQQEIEVCATKNGKGTVMSRKGVIMHCKTCKKAGHNARKCPDKDTTNNRPEYQEPEVHPGGLQQLPLDLMAGQVGFPSAPSASRQGTNTRCPGEKPLTEL
ncbi:hypothetical protein LINPERHAP2_LOCUS15636 [Linum perenne]